MIGLKEAIASSEVAMNERDERLASESARACALHCWGHTHTPARELSGRNLIQIVTDSAPDRRQTAHRQAEELCGECLVRQ